MAGFKKPQSRLRRARLARALRSQWFVLGVAVWRRHGKRMDHPEVLKCVGENLSDPALLARFATTDSSDPSAPSAGREATMPQGTVADPLLSRPLCAQCYALGEAVWRRYGEDVSHPDIVQYVDEEIIDPAMRARFALPPLTGREVVRRRQRRALERRANGVVIP